MTLVQCSICGKYPAHCKCGTLEGYIKSNIEKSLLCEDLLSRIVELIPVTYRGTWFDIWGSIYNKAGTTMCRSCIHGIQHEIAVNPNCLKRRYRSVESVGKHE